jgi:diaminohydroxyphosphoribosylaminopyrimidine deaminase/5-amino-6-(5-phosphoribosylamino)uracil reductase
MNEDQKFMLRCLELAETGLGNTYSNPMVGSVIVYNGQIIGEGFHHKAGEAHAEVNAIKAVKDKDLLRQATLYVNLEPCAHFGKTPPCSLLIKQMQIPRVVIGCTDSFSKVAGKGIQILKEAGVDVLVGVLEKESRELNKRFFMFHEEQRPYVILKWAQTLDGFIDIDRHQEDYGQPTWITNSLVKKLVHKWRRQEQAILVGTNTAIKDNPSLTTREWTGNNPVRILIDRLGRVPLSHQILDDTADTIVFTQQRMKDTARVSYQIIDFSENIVPQILHCLYQRELQSVIIEGGKTILQSFIDADLWDEARCFIGDSWFQNGVSAPSLPCHPFKEEKVGNSKLLFYRNDKVE